MWRYYSALKKWYLYDVDVRRTCFRGISGIRWNSQIDNYLSTSANSSYFSKWENVGAMSASPQHHQNNPLLYSCRQPRCFTLEGLPLRMCLPSQHHMRVLECVHTKQINCPGEHWCSVPPERDRMEELWDTYGMPPECSKVRPGDTKGLMSEDDQREGGQGTVWSLHGTRLKLKEMGNGPQRVTTFIITLYPSFIHFR